MSVVTGPPDDCDEPEKEWGKYQRPGDIKNMKCHDCFCCLVFLIFFAGMIAILALGIIQGKLWSLYNSWDTQGQYCGIDNNQFEGIKGSENFTFQNLKDYPYLFFDALNPQYQICVKSCPQENAITDVFLAEMNPLLQEDLAKLSEDDYIASYYVNGSQVYQYKSKPVFNRCIPDIDTTLIANATEFVEGFNQMVNSIPSLATALSSVYNLWWKILVCALGSILVSFVWIFLLRCLTGCIVYLVVFLVPVLLVGIGVWLFLNGDVASTLQTIKETESLSAGQITAFVLWAIALIIILIIIFLFKKLKQAVQMIKISAKALGSNCVVVFIPILSMIIALVFWALIIVSSVYTYTSSDFEVIYDEERQVDRIEFQSDKVMQYLLIYNFVYLIFISVHVYFTNYYVMSATIVNWYYSGQDGIGCGCTCFRGFFLAFTKSLGTITVSSILMTPLYIFILFMEYLDYKSRVQDASALIKCVIKCFKCCLICFTKIINYLNKTLLTIQQIFNKNWWKSAGIVTDVIVSDIVMTSLLNGVSFFILFLSKIFVSGITTLLFCLWVYEQDQDVAGFILSGFIVFFLSYICATFLLSAYSNVIDVVFVCYQSEKAIPNYEASDAAHKMDEQLNEMKEARIADCSGKVANEDSGEEMEDYSEKEVKIRPTHKHRHHHH